MSDPGEVGDDVKLRLELVGDRRRYRAGEVVSGELIVEAPQPRRCDRVLVRLWWRAWGKQSDTDARATPEQRDFCEYGELSGEQRFPFSLRIPADGPLTFKGDLIDVGCGVAARVQWPGEEEDSAAFVDLKVEPGALTCAAGEPPISSLTTWPAILDRAPDPSTAEAFRGARQEGSEARASRIGEGAFAYAVVGVIALGGLYIVGLLLAALVQWTLRFDSVWPWVINVLLIAWALALAWRPSQRLAKRLHDRLVYGGFSVALESVPLAIPFGETATFTARLRRKPRRPIERIQWEVRVLLRSGRRVKKTRRGSTSIVTEWDHHRIAAASGSLEPPVDGSGQLTFSAAVRPGMTSTFFAPYRRCTWEARVWVTSRGVTKTDGRTFVLLPVEVISAVDAQPELDGVGVAEVAEVAEVVEEVTLAEGAEATGESDATESAAKTDPAEPVGKELRSAAASRTATGGAVDARRRAAFAVARLRINRWSQARTWADRLLLVAIVSWPLPLFAFLIEILPPAKEVPVVFALPVVLLGAVGVSSLVVVVPWTLKQIGGPLLKLLFFGPWWLLRWLAERRVEATLLRHGAVERSELTGHWLRRKAVEHLLALEPGLVLDAGRLRPRSVGPPESCPQCAAGLGHPGPGLRRCEHCGFERFDEPPARSAALEAAAEIAGAVRYDATIIGPRELFRRYLDRAEPKLRTVRWWSLAGIGLLLVGAVLIDLTGGRMGTQLETHHAWMLYPAVIAGLAGGIGMLWCAFRWCRARFARFRPGLIGFDLAVRDEILRLVAHQGSIRLDPLAAHIGLSRAQLDRVLADVERRREIPIHVDHGTETLVAIWAGAPRESTCSACGGQLEPATGGAGRCAHCGSLQKSFGG